jgi:hypothetical protein
MIKFILGIIVGILICCLFIYFGGGKTVKSIGEGLTDTGKKMEAVEDLMKKEADDALKDVKKKVLKEEKVPRKEGQ